MTQRKKFRFGDRTEGVLAQGASTEPVLSPEDDANLHEYVVKIDETVALLKFEIAEIKKGNIEVVRDLFEKKERALKWLELRTPLVEPFLNHAVFEKLAIQQKLSELKRNIEEDDAMLSRMAVAARTIMREFEKIINRNGLDGVYGKSGQKLGKTSALNLSVDKKF